MTTRIVQVTLLLLLASVSPVPIRSFSVKTSKVSTSSTVSSRRDWITTSLILGSASVAWSPLMAKADITNKVASSAALRNVKRSQKQLASLELYATTEDYQGLKEAIRQPPLSEMRKNCFILVRGGEDVPDARNLQAKYQRFIQALESMDSTASLAMRGRKISEETFYDSYKGTMAALADFLSVAEEAASIPVQYDAEAISSQTI